MGNNYRVLEEPRTPEPLIIKELLSSYYVLDTVVDVKNGKIKTQV